MSENISWSHSGLSPKFLIFDFRPAVFILIWMFHQTFVFFGLFILSMIVAFILERLGYTVGIAYKILMVKVAGKTRYAVPLAEMSRSDR